MDKATEFNDVLVIKREFSASLERVFTAWTDPEVLACWFGPPGFIVNRSIVDLQVGGEYDIEIQSPDGERIRHFGEYVEIDKPDKLVFTWMLDGQSCKGSQAQYGKTMVTIDFLAKGRKTEITLTHEQLPGQEAYDGHAFGWRGCFDSLEAYFQDA